MGVGIGVLVKVEVGEGCFVGAAVAGGLANEENSRESAVARGGEVAHPVKVRSKRPMRGTGHTVLCPFAPLCSDYPGDLARLSQRTKVKTYAE